MQNKKTNGMRFRKNGFKIDNSGSILYFHHVTGDVAHKRVQKNYIASDSAKKIMKKHGIHTMYEDWNGKWWFKRDGKKIFLEGKDE